jgi:hypothetical protein
MISVRALAVVATMVAVVAQSSIALSQATALSTYRYGLALGVPISSASLENTMLVGRTTWYPSKRINFRSEASALIHVLDRDAGALETPPCPSTCAPSPPAPPKDLAGLSAHVIINDDNITRGESGGYYILGGGVYRGLSPSDVGSAGGAFEGGIGFKFNNGAGSLEIKYLRIRHWIGGQQSFLPITLGLAW